MNKKLLEKNGLTEEDFEPAEVSITDKLEAQITYTALMTDTLLEEEE